MRRAIKVIDEAAIFFSILVGVYFWVSFLIINIFTYLKSINGSPL